MAKKSKWDDCLNKEIIDRLTDEGYELYSFNKYHIRLSHEDSTNQVELWAGSGKCMQTGARSVYKFRDWNGFENYLKAVFKKRNL